MIIFTNHVLRPDSRDFAKRDITFYVLRFTFHVLLQEDTMNRFLIWTLTGFTFIALLGFSPIGTAQVDTWTKKADMPTARWSLSTSVVNGKIYAIGGWMGSAPMRINLRVFPTFPALDGRG
jgi:hypothetical protein